VEATFTVNPPEKLSILCPDDQSLCINETNIYTIAPLDLINLCPKHTNITISYEVTGSTSRNGTGNDASGIFNEGISVITWTVTDHCGNISTCSSTITIEPLNIKTQELYICEDELPFTWYGHIFTEAATVTDRVSSITDACDTIRTLILNIYDSPVITYTSIDAVGNAANGSVDVTVSGGLPPYTYNWSGPDGFTSSNEDISGLLPGDYTLTVTDANGCSATITITIGKIDCDIAITAISANAICDANNGSVTVEVTGGTPEFTFEWIGPDGFTSTSQNINGLKPGEYTVTVTDSNNCTATTSIIVDQELTIIGLVAEFTPTLCAASNGTVTLTVSGGATPYTYAWTGPGGFTATTKDLDNLAPGEYTVIVTDANGCEASTSVTVAQQDSDITVQLTATPTICEAVNGSITLTVSDGLAPYTYLWSGPDGFTSTEQNLTGLANGTYSVVVTDANGCEGRASIEVIKDLTAIGITAVHTPTLCAASNGTVTLTVSGGATPYTYAWSGPNGFTATTKDLDNLAPGEYTVIVTDANGCQASTSVTVRSAGF
jgi:hypothetical protein